MRHEPKPPINKVRRPEPDGIAPADSGEHQEREREAGSRPYGMPLFERGDLGSRPSVKAICLVLHPVHVADRVSFGKRRCLVGSPSTLRIAIGAGYSPRGLAGFQIAQALDFQRGEMFERTVAHRLGIATGEWLAKTCFKDLADLEIFSLR